MKFCSIVWMALISVALMRNATGQGFVNLDFESANISQNQGLGIVNTVDALPGWNVFDAADGPQTQMEFEGFIGGVGLPTPWVTLLGTHNIGDGSSIEGGFSVYLSGIVVETPGEMDAPAGSINQTGLVPANAQSILFKAQSGSFAASFVVTLDGQNIPYVPLATTPNYTLYGGDISAFAGQVSELAFTAGIYGIGWNLDSIEFSSQPVPEPNIFGLLAFGGLLFRLCRSN
jgi:hypothetical protein